MTAGLMYYRGNRRSCSVAMEWGNLSLGSGGHVRRRLPSHSLFAHLLNSFLLLAYALNAAGQTTAPQQNPAPPPSNPTLTSPSNLPAAQDTPDNSSTFKVTVNLVLTRVVVRDSKGHAIGNLRADNFELLADRKRQTIRYFAVDHAANPAPANEPRAARSGIEHREAVDREIPPHDFVAYVFDDVHLKSSDLVNAKSAALRHLVSLSPSARVAIFSMSGHVMLDFTNDEAKIRENISKLQPTPFRTGVGEQLPSLNGLPGGGAAEAAMLQQQAHEQKFNDEQQGQAGLDGLNAVVRRLSTMPGLKTMVVISPDFSVSNQPLDIASYQSLIESALRAHVIVNGLDPRGLISPMTPGCDINEECPKGPLAAVIAPEKPLAPVWTPALMYELTYTTGGTYFHSSNDLDEGFRRVDSIPEFSYVLGFSPAPVKSDGLVHPLQVRIKNSKGLTVQARRGYYAPKNLLAGLEDVNQEIQNEILSREEVHAFPVEFHTQFYRAETADIHLRVLIHTDARQLLFHRVDGVNRQDLTLACGLFDENGNYVKGIKQDMEMRLSDETLAKLDSSGVTTQADLVIRPGIYFIRVVVRDDRGRISTADDVIDTR
jgi:VWFA-related protein